MSTCYLYVIAHAGGEAGLEKPVKVGITTNLAGRMSALQTGNHRRLVYAMTLATPVRKIAADMEEAFHKLQDDSRLEGEWFDIDVGKAMHLLCLYFDIAIQLNIGDEDDEDGLAEAIREHSGLNRYRSQFEAQL